MKSRRILGAQGKPSLKRGIATLLLVGWAVVGCGQKGPLYLPKPAQPGTTGQSPSPQRTQPPANNAVVPDTRQ